MIDNSVFPDPVYKETVLAPLFDGAKAHYVGAVRAINQAHLVMLKDADIISGTDACKIALALRDIDENLNIDAIDYTGEYEDYFFLVEAELKNRIGPDLAGALHTARSRNDMDHTVFKMVLTDKLDRFVDQAHRLLDALIMTAEREKATLIVAYTHGQPAQPSTFGHYLAAVIEILIRDIERLLQARKIIEKCPMGAAAITTSGFPINREQISDLLGFRSPLQNSYSCIAAVDYVTGCYSAMKLMFVHLGRVVQDFQFWSSFEVDQLYVPNSFVQISSIMPQKRNPVPIEHLRLLSSLSVGHCDMMVNIMHNTPFTDMNDSEGEVQQTGYKAFDTGNKVLALLAAFIPVLSINQTAVKNNIDASCITITELADSLVRYDTLSFRQAHEIAAITSRSVIAKKQALATGYIAFTKAFEAEAGRTTNISEIDFKKFVSPENFIEVRDRFGGPAKEPMDIALHGYQNEMQNMQQTMVDNEIFKTKAKEMRSVAFNELMVEQGII